MVTNYIYFILLTQRYIILVISLTRGLSYIVICIYFNQLCNIPEITLYFGEES